MKEKKYITTVIVVMFVLVVGIFYGYANMEKNKSCVTSLTSSLEEKGTEEELMDKEDEKNAKQEEVSDGSIYVHICGQVKNPGVYQLTANARISDGIKAAGGLTKKAAPDAINQAEFLEDGTQIYIPSIKEINASKSEEKKQDEVNTASSTLETNSSKINLNLATKEELMSIPGIGAAKADSIITYREEHGDFKSIEDIKNISGIKDGVFNSISDYITV